MSIRKVTLNINGADRYIFCEQETDTLAGVLRRIGLTGTKIGCGMGLCGACSVIYNGKVIRSCVKKMKNVEDHAIITTIEGIGTANQPHPLQLAWMRFGGVQCGFCSPGFIVSAKALLDSNPAPSREEVRQWFQAHKNVCRCTGYKPLVDCVMEAAKVMRGEASPAHLLYQEPEDKAYYGTAVIRPAALAKVCGTCDYGDDLGLKMPPGALHLAIVMPRAAHHARIKSIDSSAAETMPGVVRVITAKDIKGTNLLGARMNHPRSLVNQATWPVLAHDKIYRYGDVVAVVAAETREQARAAAKKVLVDLEPLPEYLDFLDAALPDAMEIHPGIPNIYARQPLFCGEEDTREVIAGSAHAVSGSFRTTRQPHMMLEPDCAQAFFDEDGKLVVACKTQHVYGALNYLASAIGIDSDRLRVVENPTGASFGAATNPHCFAITALCALDLGKPVTLTMDWEETQHFNGKRCPALFNGRMACDETGRITALEVEAAGDHGAYHEQSGALIERFVRFIAYPYYIPNARALARLGYTNHNHATAYRGFGAPQAETCLEQLMDLLAYEAKIDPFEFRYLNIAREGEPMVNGYPYPEYPMEEIFNTARPIYEEMVATAAAASTPDKQRAVGVACASYCCTGGNGDNAGADLELNPDGSVTNFNTWEDQGQGGDVGTVMHTLKCLEPLGLRPDQVHVVMNDSKYCPDSGMAGGSRSHMMVGHATLDAARQLLDAMRKPDGSYRTYEEMTAAGLPTKYKGYYEIGGIGLVNTDPNTGAGCSSPTLMYGLVLADVEVDMQTGKAVCKRYITVDDIGAIGNSISVEGQAFGGASHCIGFALSENYDDVKKHANMKGAGIPYPLDIPDDMQLYHLCTLRKHGPHGSAGCSELYQSGGHMAVINAIYRACGVRVYELPAYPEKIKAGLDILAAGGSIEPPQHYFLGGDLYEELEEIKANPV